MFKLLSCLNTCQAVTLLDVIHPQAAAGESPDTGSVSMFSPAGLES